MSEATNLRPYSKIIITRVSDGEGGWTFTEDSTTTVYLNVEIHSEGVKAICRLATPLTVKDKIRIDGALYEVESVLRQDGGLMKELTLVRQDKPIEPVE